MKVSTIRPLLFEISKMIIPTVIGFSLAYITFSKQFDANEKGRLNDNLNKILDVNLSNPYFENSSFIERWNHNKVSNSDSSQKYETYCIYVFNFLQSTCEYFNYDKEKIEAFVDMDELAQQHISWWKLPENAKSYPDRFKAYINKNYK